MPSSSIKRSKKIAMGLTLAGVAALAFTAPLPANAAASEVGTWILHVNPQKGTKTRSITVVSKGSQGTDNTACFNVDPNKGPTINMTGTLFTEVDVWLWPNAGCTTGEKGAPGLTFNTPGAGEDVTIDV